jgi:hypothetical protein
MNYPENDKPSTRLHLILMIAMFVLILLLVAATSAEAKGKPDPGPSECNFNFKATFDDLAEDGIWSDGNSYDAIGGKGFRLDTNGSIKLERQNDTRFIRIDFSKATPDGSDCDSLDSIKAADAAGFCDELQGVDLRLEHQIQDLETTGLCTMKKGDPPKLLAVRLGFEAEAGGLLQNPFKNGKQNGSGSVALNLSYGCLAPNLEQNVLDLDYRAEVTRTGPKSWTIEGIRACLHTNLGHMLRGSNGKPIYLTMPFGLTIVDVDE